VNTYEVDAGMVYWESKLSDPYLSTFSVPALQ